MRPSRLLSLAALSLSVAAFLTGCGQKPQAAAPPPPTVTVIKPLAKKATEYAEFTGRLAAVDYVEIRPRVSGYIVEIPFKEGQIVKKGDVLFVIDPRPYEATLAQAKGQFEQATAQKDLADRNFARAEELLRTKVSSKEDFDTRATARNQADAGLATAKATAAAAQLNLDFTRITAPVEGRVSRPFVTVGNLVGADATTLTNIVSVDPMYAYADIDERTVLAFQKLIREGKLKSARDSEVEIGLSLANETGFPHRGVIDFVDNQIASATGTLQVRGKFPNPQAALLAGMFVRVRIPTSPEYDALLIPERALVSDQGQKFLLVVGGDGKVVRRRVVLGQVHDGLRSVREGLDANDQVIVEGLLKARPGSEVKTEMGDVTKFLSDQMGTRPVGAPAASPSASPAPGASPSPGASPPAAAAPSPAASPSPSATPSR